MQSLPLVAPLVETLRLGPEIEDGFLDVVVDGLADVYEVIVGGGPDPQRTQRSLT
jgi:hypothetical protein